MLKDAFMLVTKTQNKSDDINSVTIAKVFTFSLNSALAISHFLYCKDYLNIFPLLCGCPQLLMASIGRNYFVTDSTYVSHHMFFQMLVWTSGHDDDMQYMHLLNNVCSMHPLWTVLQSWRRCYWPSFGLCLSSETLGNCRFFSYIHYSIVDLSVVFMPPERATHDVRTDSLMHSSCRGCTLHQGASKYLQVSKDGLYEVV